MNNENFKEVVVITGSSAGVGRATARKFASEGARIALLARGKDGLKGAVRDVESLGGEALAIKTDVADPRQVESAADKVEKKLGPIDIWINNAMTSVFAPFKDITPAEFKRVTEVTYLGFVYGTMAALKRMLPRDRGTIVQVGSALAFRGIPLQSAYCGAKHGIRGFTDSLRSELLHDKSNVYLTMVHLPGMNTPQFLWCKSKLPNKAQPVPPIFQPEIAADALHWAVRHKKRDMLVAMPTVKAVWGSKFLKGVLDKYLAKKGYTSQQTDEKEDPSRPSNLFDPVRGDFGPHGNFDSRAKGRSIQLMLEKGVFFYKQSA
jgi:short-subunit dehydrogenase